MSDFDKVFEILEKYEDKDFVKRILYPDESPAIVNADGSFSTHKMGTASADGKHWVFPTILRDDRGILQDYTDPDDKWAAFKEAMKRKEAIPFDTHEDAEWFEKNWKIIWKPNGRT